MMSEKNIKRTELMDTEVSVFSSIFDKTPCGRTSLGEWLMGDRFKTEAERMRTMLEEGKNAQYREEKKKLPCITPSGAFDNLFEGAVPTTYSHFMCVDIDRKDNLHIADFDKMKEKISAVNCVSYCGHSISGQGYMLLVPIAYPEKYALHYAAFEEDMNRCNIITDPTCKNIGRLRICSHDPNPYINTDARTYCKTREKTLSIPTNRFVFNGKATPRKWVQYNSPEETEKKIIKMTDYIVRNNIDITNDYRNWFKVGCALADALGEDGRTYFHSISSVSDKYSWEECERQYTSCQCVYNGSRHRAESFFGLCKDYNVLYKDL